MDWKLIFHQYTVNHIYKPVNNMVTDGLAPMWRQGICNYIADLLRTLEWREKIPFLKSQDSRSVSFFIRHWGWHVYQPLNCFTASLHSINNMQIACTGSRLDCVSVYMNLYHNLNTRVLADVATVRSSRYSADLPVVYITLWPHQVRVIDG